MGLYNFQERFVPAILAGDKTHTIRAERRHNDMPGSTMHLYAGLRHKGARLLMRRRCIKVEYIGIERDLTVWIGARMSLADQNDIGGPAVPGGRIILDRSEMEALAKRDGFRSFSEMAEFWNGKLPFFGIILHWEPTPKEGELYT
jgi:hypothetical protein